MLPGQSLRYIFLRSVSKAAPVIKASSVTVAELYFISAYWFTLLPLLELIPWPVLCYAFPCPWEIHTLWPFDLWNTHIHTHIHIHSRTELLRYRHVHLASWREGNTWNKTRNQLPRWLEGERVFCPVRTGQGVNEVAVLGEWLGWWNLLQVRSVLKWYSH